MTGIRRVSQLGTTGESTYVDGSIQAADIAANAITQAKLSTDIPLSGMRNLIINGDMVINQRNTAVAGSGYSVDRWTSLKFGNSTTISIAQSADAPPNFTNSLKMTTVTGAAATSAWLYQRIEGYNAASLGFGTASAKQVTVSFWVKSSLSGTYSVTLQNNNATRVYAASYTISAADTWEYKTVTIPGDTTGSWLQTTNSGLDVYFPFVLSGTPSSSYVPSTLNAWFTGAGGMAFNVGTSATPNVTATTGNIFAITGVQLEAGSQATPFEQLPIGVELPLCQRYFHVIPAGNIKAVNQYATVGLSGGNLLVSHTFPVTMRADPTAYTSGGSGSHSFDFYQSSAGAGIARVLVYQSGQSTTTIGFKTLAYSSDNNGGNLLPSNGHLIGILNTAVWVSAEL
jgi:hypothetical protein